MLTRTPWKNSSAASTALTALVIVAALVFAKEILLPIALAVLLSFILTPVADQFEKWRVGRVPSVAVVVVLAFALLAGIGWIVTSQLMDLSRELPQYKTNVVAKIRAIAPSSATLEKVTATFSDMGKELTGHQPDSKSASTPKPDPQESTKSSPAAVAETSSELTNHPSGQPIEVKVVELPPSPLAQLRAWLGPLLAPLTTAGMVVVLVFFLLIHREDQRNRLIRLFGAANLHTTTEALNDAAERISRYLRMQFVINAGFGVLIGIGLSVIGIPNALMWGVLGFSLRFLPYVGPWLAAAIPMIVSLAISTSWTQPVLVFGWYVTLELVASNIAEPWLYGRSVGISGLGIILAAIVWTWLWGPVGLVLAVPLTVCLVVLAQYIPQLRFITILVGDQPTLSLEERIYQRLLAFDEDEARELAAKFLATASPLELYDNVLIPVLIMAERDRHADVLREDQLEFVQDTVADLVQELDRPTQTAKIEGQQSIADGSGAVSPRILCIPVHDQNDHTSTVMLGQLLAAEGFQVDVGSLDSLTNELVDDVANLQIDIAVTSMLPPTAARGTRLLRKRLRSRYPTLPIVVGYWHGRDDEKTVRRFDLDSDSRLTTSLSDAMVAIRTAAAQLKLTAVSDAAG